MFRKKDIDMYEDDQTEDEIFETDEIEEEEEFEETESDEESEHCLKLILQNSECIQGQCIQHNQKPLQTGRLQNDLQNRQLFFQEVIFRYRQETRCIFLRRTAH